MSGANAPSLQSLLTLLKQTSLEDHDQVLKAANNALKGAKDKTDVLHIKLVALIKLDRFDDALRVFSAGGDKLKDRARLEYAYALYKAGRLSEAEDVAAGPQGSLGIRHVLAQAAYRLEHFERAAEVYKDLISQAQLLGEDGDVRVNINAVNAQLAWQPIGRLHLTRESDQEDSCEAYETVFNAACSSIARREYDQAKILLQKAEDLCAGLEDLSDNDKMVEIATINVQLAYVLLRQGRSDEAQALLTDDNIRKIQDLSTRKAAMANLLATSQVPFNSYLLHRRFHFTSEQSKTKQLFSFQAIPLRYNALVLDLLSFKFDKVARSISSLHPSHSNLVDKDRNALFVLLSAAVAHNQDGKAGLKRLLALLKQRPTDLGILLTVIQFYCVLGNKSTALALLKACLERFETKPGGEEGLRYAPGLVATLVALYSFQGRRPQIKLALKEAASFWRGKPRTHSSSSLLKAAGITLLSSSKQSDLLFASELLRDLHQQNGSDDLVAAGFTVACAATASEISRTPELDDLASIQSNAVSGINAVALEEGGVLQAPHARGQTMDRGKRRKGPEKFDGGGERKPKRIRKSRLPKDYDPNRVPNPERWLPLQDRSTYKLKGKKNKARMVGSTQGGDALDSKDKLSSSGGAVVDLAKRRGKRDKSAR